MNGEGEDDDDDESRLKSWQQDVVEVMFVSEFTWIIGVDIMSM